MVKHENECVGCPPEMGCLGRSCPNRNVVHLYCDKCGEDVEVLYNVDGEELCEECTLGSFSKITLDDDFDDEPDIEPEYEPDWEGQ